MEITCEKCGALIPLDIDQGGAIEIACPVCWEVIRISGERVRREKEDLYGEGRIEGWKGDILGFDIRGAGGAYLGYYDPYLIKVKIWNREFSGEEEVRPEGGEWIPIYELKEFKEVFNLLGIDPEIIKKKRSHARQKVLGWKPLRDVKKAKKERIIDSFAERRDSAGADERHLDDLEKEGEREGDSEKVKGGLLKKKRTPIIVASISIVLLAVVFVSLLLFKGKEKVDTERAGKREGSDDIIIEKVTSLLFKDDIDSYDKALKILRERVEIDKRKRARFLPLMLETLLHIYENNILDSGSLERAGAILKELEEEKGEIVEVMRSKASYLLATLKMEESLEVLRGLPEDDPFVACLKGEVFIRMRRVEEGRETLLKLVASYPYYIRPHSLLIWEAIRSGRDPLPLIEGSKNLSTMNETILLSREYARYLKGEVDIYGAVKNIKDLIENGTIRSLKGEGRANYLISLMACNEGMTDAELTYRKRAWGMNEVSDEEMKNLLALKYPTIDFERWKRVTWTAVKERGILDSPSVRNIETLLEKRRYAEAIPLLKEELSKEGGSPYIPLLLFRVSRYLGGEAEENALEFLRKGMNGRFILPSIFREAVNFIEEEKLVTEIPAIHDLIVKKLEEDPIEEHLLYEAGRILLIRSDIRGADFVKRALQLDPFDHEFLLTSGETLLSEKKLDEAEVNVRKSLFFKQDNIPGLILLSKIEEERGRLNEAISILKEGAKIDPEEWGIPVRIGILLVKEGRIEEGIHTLEKAKDFAIKDHDLHLYLGIGYLKRGAEGDVERAKREFFQAVEIDPESTAAHIELGKIYMLQGDFLAAQGEFEKAMRKEPENLDVLEGLANSFYAQGAYEEALEIYEKVILLSKDRPDLYLKVGKCYHNLDRGDIALKYYKLVPKDHPDQAEVSYRMGLISETRGDRKGAKRLYQKAISLKSSYAPPYRTLGYIYKDENNCPKAIEYLEKYIELEKDKGEIDLVKSELSFIKEDCRD